VRIMRNRYDNNLMRRGRKCAFLNNDWPELYETAREAEQNVTSTPLSHRMYALRSLERAVKRLYANDSYLKQPYDDNLAALGFDFAQPPVVARSLSGGPRSLSGAEGNPASSPRSSQCRKSAIWPSIVINRSASTSCTSRLKSLLANNSVLVYILTIYREP
jgi:hypothetical protein